MILPCILLLLNTPEIEEFLFQSSQMKIHIRGHFENGEWIVHVLVRTETFAWGCNTKMKGSFQSVTRYYVHRVLAQLLESSLDIDREFVEMAKTL